MFGSILILIDGMQCVFLKSALDHPPSNQPLRSAQAKEERESPPERSVDVALCAEVCKRDSKSDANAPACAFG